MKEGIKSLRIVKEPYRISIEDQAHYFLCDIERDLGNDCTTLSTEQFNAIEMADMVEISVTAFYKRLNKWGYESDRIFDERKAVTLTFKDLIGNEAWRALSDEDRDENLAKIPDGSFEQRVFETR